MLDDNFVLTLEVVLATNWTQGFLNANELEDGAHASVDQDVGIRDCLINM